MKEKNSVKDKVLEYADQKFGTKPEYLWSKFPNYAVLRNNDNLKWYAVIMNVSRKKLGLNEDEKTDILNVKCDPNLIESVLDNKRYFRAYHMNKVNWMTILLDGSVAVEEILNFLDLSFEIVTRGHRKNE